MKISIITLQNVSNYGSVLQAYATQLYFQTIGYDVELVDYWRKNMLDSNIADELVENEDLKLKKCWGNNYILKLIVKKLMIMRIKKRAKPFRKFVRNNITTTKMMYTSFEQLLNNPPTADVYCVGSDQVWNSDWNEGLELAFYLEFVPKGKQKIAFSSSFGVEELSQKEKRYVKQYLNGFDLITVRESSAVDLLNNINIIGAKWILDPTLILTKEQWESLVDKKKKKKGKYILVYQLNDNELFDEAVKEAAKLTSSKVIRLEYRKTKKYGKHVVRPSVSEWITYFYNADYVITDSFHATAFSINFEKQFINILPPKFETRINSVLELFGLLNRKINTIEKVAVLTSMINYVPVMQVLDGCRKDVNVIFSKKDGDKNNIC